ncbi:prephenate dehydrogenase [Dehalococcoides mccartyi]|jgi:prephenate dehydrogenase|uniref:Prephenate dehydrogenase n=2 Tax=Dehalococcoides TaxID=61434 RepID=A0A142VA71_9CHLR|nr:prephenate dehydrogenase [Dehalococcoides mccartyi]AII60563.1 prephenate dehydrogenase [Dehalococcoides mccartyi CG5]AMU86227.1 prephenate dehydrogenase [Dehalococcoides mccartyi]AOV99065.1 prephenate/arogenate dehydrogenase [Dehalococcoides mccartyi]MBA2084838.1 Prephenate and/or arogenate dehydrogenase [Dehalococcoides mccartyi]QBX63575.1 prephenate dehydrogenase [Dehalococcoides mccartyi]
MKIGILGGSGKMGQWFGRFLTENGHQVWLWGRNPSKLAPIATRLGVQAATRPDMLGDMDCLIISVPIDAFEDTLRELAPFTKPDQLVFDLCSVKERPVELMHQYLPHCRTLGTHPVFGPGAESLKGYNFILTPTTAPETDLAQGVKTWLEKQGGNVRLISPEEHDRLMSVVLGLAHFIAIVSADTLLGQNLPGISSAGGTTFRLLDTLTKSVLTEDPGLYASLQVNMPKLPKLEADFIKRATEWAELVKNGDKAEFARRMQTLKDNLARTEPGFEKAYQAMYHLNQPR